MAPKRLLTIFGATGNQGGSIINLILERPEFSSKYALRGVTRDPASSKSQALASRGVEMVRAELDDLESLRRAVRGSHGVFGVTDFWSVRDKEREIQQGKNIFEASSAERVAHLVFSSLPHAEKLTGGQLRRVEHFDSKALVAEYIEARKGDMLASYYMPAMFIDFVRMFVKNVDGTPTLAMPFAEDTKWPLIEPRRDGGKYVVGLFEAGKQADGVWVHGVSTWTSLREIVGSLGKEAGKEVVFRELPPEVFAGFLPEDIRWELTETQQLIGGWSYFGKGEEKNQAEHDRWLVKDADLISWTRWAHENGPWEF